MCHINPHACEQLALSLFVQYGCRHTYGYVQGCKDVCMLLAMLLLLLLSTIAVIVAIAICSKYEHLMVIFTAIAV